MPAFRFLIKIVAGGPQPPTCLINGNSSNAIVSGVPFSISVSGTDPEGQALGVVRATRPGHPPPRAGGAGEVHADALQVVGRQGGLAGEEGHRLGQSAIAAGIGKSAQAEALRLRRVRDIDERRRKIDEITLRAAAKILPDAPSPDEIIGYDEDGLPR